MEDQNKNLILATALSFLVILVWFLLFPPEDPQVTQTDAAVASDTTAPADAILPPSAGSSDPVLIGAEETRAVALSSSARVAIETDELLGSISLLGGRIDDLSLKNYRETIDEDANIVRLLSPVGGPNAYYALYGWAPGLSLIHI